MIKNTMSWRRDTKKARKSWTPSIEKSKGEKERLAHWMNLRGSSEIDTLSVSFSSSRWNAMVERVDVFPEGRMVFRFVCGREVVV